MATPTVFCRRAATPQGQAVLLRYTTNLVRNAVMEFKRRGYDIENKEASTVFEVFHLKRAVLVEVASRSVRGGFEVRAYVDGQEVKTERIAEAINKSLTAKEQADDDF